MKINKVYEKVRKNATRKFAKTGLPDGKSLPEDWSPSSQSSSTEFSPSMDFSADTDYDGSGLPAMPLDADDSGSEGKEPRFYRGSPRVVFFDEEVLVRRVRPVFRIGGNIDRRLLWYQEDEYKEIMWKARKMVKRALNDEENTNNTEKYCLRGLEHVVNSVTRRTKENFDGREAVLDEQCDQFQKEVFPLDDNKIASVYVPHTKAHRKEAIQRAMSDAEEADLYHKTSSSTSSRAGRSTHSLHSSSLHSLQAPKTPRSGMHTSHSHSSLNASHSSLNGSVSSFASPTSPKSPSLHKPGMVFTTVNNTIQYPDAMRLESI